MQFPQSLDVLAPYVTFPLAFGSFSVNSAVLRLLLDRLSLDFSLRSLTRSLWHCRAGVRSSLGSSRSLRSLRCRVLGAVTAPPAVEFIGKLKPQVVCHLLVEPFLLLSVARSRVFVHPGASGHASSVQADVDRGIGREDELCSIRFVRWRLVWAGAKSAYLLQLGARCPGDLALLAVFSTSVESWEEAMLLLGSEGRVAVLLPLFLSVTLQTTPCNATHVERMERLTGESGLVLVWRRRRVRIGSLVGLGWSG